MERQFDHELGRLKEELLAMASHAEAAVKDAVRAYLQRDDALARSVIERDSILDAYEMAMDDAAVGLLALKAPVASDLRLITTAMKISHDLERAGDEATTIARRALQLNEEPPLKSHVDIPRMAELGIQMLREAIDSFISRDSAAARAIIPRDKQVDSLNKEVHRELIGIVTADAATLTRALNLMVISKSLERVADHATNIAEEVVYLCEAADIRHHHTRREPTANEVR